MKTRAMLSVDQVFARAAPHYDLMNDLMSGGLHRLWKKTLIDMIPATDGWLADIAGGSGDIAWRALATQKALKVLLCDSSSEMLAQAKKVFDRSPAAMRDRLFLVQSDGVALPFSDGRIHHCTISFGIRNIADRGRALAEMFRILRPGGRFLCLEFSNNILPVLRAAYDFYSDHIIPLIAQQISGDEAPYEYLVESIRQFPSQEEFATMVAGAGFSRVRCYNLSGGIAVIYSAVRI